MTQAKRDLTAPRTEAVVTKLGDAAVRLATAPSQLIYWLSRSGSPAVAGATGTYLFLVCVESYYRALPTAGAAASASIKSIEQSIEEGEVSVAQIEAVEARPPFLPKPGINDGASFDNFALVNGGELALCTVVALMIQALQGSFQRGKSPAKAKAEFEEAAKHHISDTPPENRITLAGVRHKAYKKSGLAPRRRNGALIGLSYAIDGGAALAAFGGAALSGGLAPFLVAGAWAVAAIAGPETCWGWMQDRIDEAKAEAQVKGGATAPQRKDLNRSEFDF